MNIFILDEDIDTCARYHVDKHVVKMILEGAQLLCTTLVVDKVLGHVPDLLNKHQREAIKAYADEWRPLNIVLRDIPYMPTHVNHPCAVWARTSMDNYYWLYCYTMALGAEYTYRYGKEHKSIGLLNACAYSPNHLPETGLTPFAQAMPDQYKHPDAITAYRNYYIGDKNEFASWKHRGRPNWYPVEV